MLSQKKTYVWNRFCITLVGNSLFYEKFVAKVSSPSMMRSPCAAFQGNCSALDWLLCLHSWGWLACKKSCLPDVSIRECVLPAWTISRKGGGLIFSSGSNDILCLALFIALNCVRSQNHIHFHTMNGRCQNETSKEVLTMPNPAFQNRVWHS